MRPVRYVVAVVLAVSGLALAPAQGAEAVIPHIDPLSAIKAMRSPPPPQAPANDQWQRYQDALIAAQEKAKKERFQHAGPWELIAAETFGVYAKPEPNANAADPNPTPTPVSPPPVIPRPGPAVHSPVHVLPIPLKTDAPHPTAAPATTPPAATPAPAPTTTSLPTADAAHSQNSKPILPHDTVMRLIRRYTEAIAKFRERRKAEEEKAKLIARAAAAWAAANPPKHPHTTADATAATPHPTPPQHPVVHHRMGVRHKLPPPPTHAMQTPSPKPQHHTQFVLKFTGVCVDNHTATALGKHHNPHHQQPLSHHLKHHRRSSGSDAEPSREIPWCSLKAQSQEITTRIHPRSGVDMSVSRMVGSVARLDLFDLSILSESEFVARGNLSFGSTRHRPHSVAMESAGSARVFKFETGSRAFAASFQVTGGSGGFDGHRGTLTLNGVLQSLNRVEALVTGVLYPPEDLTARRMSALKRSPFYRPLPPKPQPEPTDSDGDDDGDEEDDAEDGDDDEPVKAKAKPTHPQPHRIRLRP